MQKRERKAAEEKQILEETLFQAGVTVSYYNEGWRWGHITDVEVDDDGDLFVTLQPLVSKYTLTKPRKVSYKAKDLKLA